MGAEQMAGPERNYFRKHAAEEGYVPPPPHEGVRPSIMEKAKALEPKQVYQAFKLIYQYAEAGKHFDSKVLRKRKLAPEVLELLGEATITEAINYGGLKFKIKESKHIGEDKKVKKEEEVEIYLSTGVGDGKYVGSLYPAGLAKLANE